MSSSPIEWKVKIEPDVLEKIKRNLDKNSIDEIDEKLRRIEKHFTNISQGSVKLSRAEIWNLL